MLNWVIIEEIIRKGFEEDIHYMDVTTDNLIDESSQSTAILIAKEDGVIAGLPILSKVFKKLDCMSSVSLQVDEGEWVSKGTKLAIIEGTTRSLLKGERLALNLLQRLSGIATMAREYSELVKEYDVRVVDTRKTTPGLRILEKYAVRVGGCQNHRYNLSDAVMIKDNHISAIGSIEEAVRRAKSKVSHTIKIEVEVSSIEGMHKAIRAGADIVMLDNMSIQDMKKAVEQASSQTILEASGGITKDKLVDVAKTGVGIISVGGLTHSVKSLDISMYIN